MIGASKPQPSDSAAQHEVGLATETSLQYMMWMKSTDVRENAFKVAKLAHDYDIMLQTNSKNSIASESNSTPPSPSSPAQSTSHLPRHASADLALSIITVAFLGAFFTHCLAIRLAGLAVLPIIFSLVILFLTIFKRNTESLPLMRVVGFLVTCAGIISFSVLILIVWMSNSRVVFFSAATSYEIWGCPEASILTDKGATVTSACITNHVLLGFWMFGTLTAAFLKGVLQIFALIHHLQARRAHSALFIDLTHKNQYIQSVSSIIV